MFYLADSLVSSGQSPLTRSTVCVYAAGVLACHTEVSGGGGGAMDCSGEKAVVIVYYKFNHTTFISLSTLFIWIIWNGSLIKNNSFSC